MSLFDKLRTVKNAVTGGGAKIMLEADPLVYDQPFLFTVQAQLEKVPLSIERVYLKISATEDIHVPDVFIQYQAGDDINGRHEDIRAQTETMAFEITVSESQALEASQFYEWKIKVALPENSPHAYKGKYCSHLYRACAGLEIHGNNPESGWIELD